MAAHQATPSRGVSRQEYWSGLPLPSLIPPFSMLYLTNVNLMLVSKGPYSQSYGFSSSHVQMWELYHKDGWDQRIDAFELWYWRRLLRVPWIARSSNQSILKEVNPEYSLEGLMLKLQYSGHLMGRTNSEKTDVGKDWRQEKKGAKEDETTGWHHWICSHEFEQTLGDSERQGSLVYYNPWGGKDLDMT